MAKHNVLRNIFHFICIIFGIRFYNLKVLPENHRKIIWFLIFQLYLFYIIFTLILILSTFSIYSYDKLNLRLSLQVFQTCVPLLIMGYIILDSFLQQKDMLKLNLKTMSVNKKLLCLIQFNEEPKSLYLIFFKNISIIILTRVLKLYLMRKVNYKLQYAIATIIPEIVCSANNFLFVFHVQLVSNQMKALNSYLKSISKIDYQKLKQIKKISLNFYTSSNQINNCFSTTLLLSITFDFFSLVISLYWLFVRISFNHLKSEFRIDEKLN